ncbi:MAG: hypothetical protein QNJ72_35450 [Pleurocapsa sp. MO_226.B13]|nr:hypothetical protein [Pleurocapsa sp. MO_226.B13]
MIEELLGWAGTATYFLAYILFTVKVISVDGLYLSLNIVASILIIIVSVAKSSWSAVLINFFWGVITISKAINCSLKLPRQGKLIFQVLMVILLAIGLSYSLVGNRYFGMLILAWCSTIGYSLSYLLFLNRELKLIEFHFWNFLLAIILIPQLVLDNNWQVVAIEIFWAGIALGGILNRNSHKEQNF